MNTPNLRVFPSVFEAITNGSKRIEVRLYKPGQHLTPMLVGLQPEEKLTFYTNAAELSQAKTQDQVQRTIRIIKHFNPSEAEKALAFLKRSISVIAPPALQENSDFQERFGIFPTEGQTLPQATIEAFTRMVTNSANYTCFIGWNQ